jgi:hypothetical protein
MVMVLGRVPGCGPCVENAELTEDHTARDEFRRMRPVRNLVAGDVRMYDALFLTCGVSPDAFCSRRLHSMSLGA